MTEIVERVVPFGGGNDVISDSVRNHCGEVTAKGLYLSFWKRFAVGSGHILNDLVASLWFSYLLLYLENVVLLSSEYAAYLMLLGQIVDGISTPLVGYETDHTTHHIFFRRSYGRCKTWHLFGVILVTLSFPFIFSPCIGCDGAQDWAKLIYYAPFIAITQIGWAATQISHLALIPKMNPDELVRTELLSIRYGFTVAANITVFIMAWQSFGFEAGNLIDSSYASSFRNVTLMAVGIGVAFSLFFHVFVHEHTDAFVKKCVALSAKESEDSQSDSGLSRSTERTRLLRPDQSGSSRSSSTSSISAVTGVANYTDVDGVAAALPPPKRTYSLSTKCLSLGRECMQVTDWLKMSQFYSVALVYMMTRLSVNVTQVYVPLYLQNSLRLPAGTVATIPLTMYVFGFIAAIFMRTISRLVGRQFSYILGALLVVAGSVCVLTLDLRGGETDVSKYGIYGVAALLGSGASVLLVTSLSITADLIGNNTESGAFVYGAMSFTDKLSCGLAVMFINLMVPCQLEDTPNCEGRATFYKHVLAFTSGGCALGGVVGVILITFLIFLSRSSQIQRKGRRQN